MINSCKLSEVAKIEISSVDKKKKKSEIKVKSCNFVDIYYNWIISDYVTPNFLNITANQNEINKFTLKKGQVAITKDSETRNDIGMSAYISKDFKKVLLGYHCALITPDETKLNGKFLNLLFHTEFAQKYFKYNSSGSGQRYTLTTDAIGNFPLFLPSLKKQLRIGDFFSEIDKIIENNNKIIVKLEEMSKSIYDYWFLQFEFPDEKGKPFKSSGGKMIWNDKLKKKIPKGWKAATINKCIKYINTGLNPRDNFVLGKGNIKYVTVKNLTTIGNIDFSGCDVIDEKARRIVHNRSKVSKGDILFASIAPLGRCVMVKETPKDWDINESVFCIRPNFEKISTEYLYSYLMSEQFIKKAEHSSTGSIFRGIRISVLEEMPILVPDRNVMKQFTDIVVNLFELKYKKEKENDKLISLRDFILPLLVNGKISFKN